MALDSKEQIPQLNIPATMPNATCPFCEIEFERVWLRNETGLVLWDGYALSEGHSLVVPIRHVASLFDLSFDELSSLWELVSEARNQLAAKSNPDGFNVGVNDGEAAGQTVMHAHIHIIPRWRQDVADPRGGVRWVLPDKAKYWNDK